LDLVLDRSELGRHGSALIFLSWANAELGHFELALAQLGRAKVLNAQLDM